MRRLATFATVALLAASCGGSAMDPTASAPSPEAVPTGSVAPSEEPTLAETPSASAVVPPTASLPAAEGPITLQNGDPWLVYAWYPESLFLVRPDGSDRHRLDLGFAGEPFAPSWSPDGERLTFVVRGGDTPNGSIWTSDASGTDAAPLYGTTQGECADGAFWPVWSPDGKRLAIVCYDTTNPDGETSVSILDPRLGKRTDLVSFKYPETVDNPPSWSPDGMTLTFEILRWNKEDTAIESSVVATIPTSGGDVTRLTEDEMFAAHPDWSPDGTRIAFNDYDTGNIHGTEHPSNVYTMAPDGSDLRQLSTASVTGTIRLGQPFWSPDGTRIWVSTARDGQLDSGYPSNRLGWVDAATGTYTEIGTEGKRFRERPT